MRPARTTKKANPVSSGKAGATASSQGRRDAGAVVSKFPTIATDQTLYRLVCAAHAQDNLSPISMQRGTPYL